MCKACFNTCHKGHQATVHERVGAEFTDETRIREGLQAWRTLKKTYMNYNDEALEKRLEVAGA